MHCDVRSLYPSIILSQKWTPARDTLGIFPKLLEKLRQFRLTAKDAMRQADTPERKNYYSALQATFKILINSFYGYLGFEQGFLNDYNMADRVTTEGRRILTSMQDFLQRHDANIIEMDTDGIYFQPGKIDVETLERTIPSILPDGIEVEFDEKYDAMFSYKSKNYALLKQNGELTISGAALKSRGLEPFQRKYMHRIILAILHEDAEAVRMLNEEYTNALTKHTLPFTELAKSETLSDSPESYKKKMNEPSFRRSAAYELALRAGRDYKQGDQISFYITGTKRKVSVVENAKLLSEADESVRDENVEYYLDKLNELQKKFAPYLPANKNAGEQPELDLFG
jgi:DNA polymerase elongation subunit (family B)